MRKLVVAVFVSALLAGCQAGTKSKGGQQNPNAEQKGQKASEFLTARTAFQKLFPSARLWAADARPFRVASEPVKQDKDKGKGGKSAVWRASFASVARSNIKLYTWSGVQAEDAPERGVSAGTEDSYNPRNTATQPFDIAFWKIDSDKAFTTAQEHGGEKLLKVTPDLPIVYLLDWNPAGSQLVWHVMYGGTGMDAKLRVAVDASTGNFLRVEK